jgi:4'-phosphopantetheinyl transferase
MTQAIDLDRTSIFVKRFVALPTLKTSGLDLQPGQVHVWVVPLRLGRNPHSRLDLLSAAEVRRVGQLKLVQQRRAYIAARSTLRVLLSMYLSMPPKAVPIGYAATGRPELPEHPIEFSVSHSGQWSAIAVARQVRVGVDIEEIDQAIDILTIARRYFDHRRYRRLLAVPEPLRARLFFRLWTRIEACAKALDKPLSTVDLRRITRLLPLSSPQSLTVAGCCHSRRYVGHVAVCWGGAQPL